MSVSGINYSRYDLKLPLLWKMILFTIVFMENGSG